MLEFIDITYIKDILFFGFNKILSYSFIILTFMSLILIILANFKKKKKRIVPNTRRKKNYKISENKVLNIAVGKISDSLSFTNSFSKETNDILGLFILILYLVVVIFIYKYLGIFAFLWYAKVINLLVALFLPYALLHTYIGIQINTITKQVPNAFSEILSAYRSDKRIKVAIETSTQYMDKHIKREFKRMNLYLGSENTFEYGLDYFAKRLNNSYITLFANLIKESRYKSADITDALEKLVIKTRTKNYMKEKAKRQLVWYRVFLIIWLFAIPAVMKFVASASLEAYRFYNTVDGAKLLSITMLSIVIGYLLIILMERS